MPFTIPPNTRAVGTADPPGDMNNASGALTAVAGINVKNSAYAGGAKGNVKTFGTGAITNATTALTASGLVTGWAGFTTADVGKTILVQGAGAAGAVLQTTIAAYVSATAVTLTAAAGTTVSAANVAYGTDDTAAIQAAINATPYGGVCVLDATGGGAYLISSTLNAYGADLTNPNPVKLLGQGILRDAGIQIIATPALGANPAISMATKYAPSGTPTQFSFGDLADIHINLTFSPSSVGIYYDRVQKCRETGVTVRGGTCGRVIGWANDVVWENPRTYNSTDSFWKWPHAYTPDAPWDTANAGNTIGGGGSTYGDPTQHVLINPFNYQTSAAPAGTANAFFTIKAGNDFTIIGGHSLRSPGGAAFVTNGINADFSWGAQKNLNLFFDYHEIDALWDGTGSGGPFLGSGAGVLLNNAHFARFGPNSWIGAYSTTDNAEEWCLKLINSSDVVLSAGGHWSGRGVLLDGVSTDVVIEAQFPQQLSDPVISTLAAGTLDVTMNTLTLPRATIAVDNMGGTLPATGTILVATTAAGPQAVSYTGQSTTTGVTTFTGCTAGTGTLATGGSVVLKTLATCRVNPIYNGTLCDNAQTLAAIVQGTGITQRTPALFMANATTPGLQVGRAMDGKTWSFGLDTSATGTLTVKNPEGSVKFQISDGGTATVTGGPLDVSTAGKGLQVAEGSNAKQGTSVLVGGTATVANTSVTATSRIFLTSNADGGTPGWLRVSARSAGTSFTITSSSGTDTSTVAWEIFEAG